MATFHIESYFLLRITIRIPYLEELSRMTSFLVVRTDPNFVEQLMSTEKVIEQVVLPSNNAVFDYLLRQLAMKANRSVAFAS